MAPRSGRTCRCPRPRPHRRPPRRAWAWAGRWSWALHMRTRDAQAPQCVRHTVRRILSVPHRRTRRVGQAGGHADGGRLAQGHEDAKIRRRRIDGELDRVQLFALEAERHSARTKESEGGRTWSGHGREWTAGAGRPDRGRRIGAASWAWHGRLMPALHFSPSRRSHHRPTHHARWATYSLANASSILRPRLPATSRRQMAISVLRMFSSSWS